MAFDVNAYHRGRYHDLPWVRAQYGFFSFERGHRRRWSLLRVGLPSAVRRMEARGNGLSAPDWERLRTVLERVLERLKPPERLVLRMRFGVGADERRYTLEEVGRKLGMTREGVRMMEARALRKLRLNPELRKLSGDLEW